MIQKKGEREQSACVFVCCYFTQHTNDEIQQSGATAAYHSTKLAKVKNEKPLPKINTTIVLAQKEIKQYIKGLNKYYTNRTLHFYSTFYYSQSTWTSLGAIKIIATQRHVKSKEQNIVA